jgi:hypothetical protein
VATLEDATEQVNLYRDALDAGECVVQEWRPMTRDCISIPSGPVLMRFASSCRRFGSTLSG